MIQSNKTCYTDKSISHMFHNVRWAKKLFFKMGNSQFIQMCW